MDAAAWDARYAASDLVWSPGPNQFVEAEVADLPPGRAVDLAAGEGRNALWLAARGWEVTAVDYSQVGLAKGAALPGGSEVTWVQADATTWTGSGFDLAVMAYLQLPAEERRDAVRNAFGALVPGGTLLVVAHDSTNLAEGTGGPSDAGVLYTAADVVGYLTEPFPDAVEVVRAERVARSTEAGTAWDALARVVRR